MRLLSCYALLILVLLLSCEEDTRPPATAFVGEWEWVISVGGFSGSWMLTPSSEGYNRYLSVNEYVVERYVDDAAVGVNPYEIDANLIGADDAPDTLLISVPDLYWSNASIIADTLRIRDGCNDCYRHLYVRR